MVDCNKSMEIAIRLGGDPPPPPDLPLQKMAVALTQTSSAWGRLPSPEERGTGGAFEAPQTRRKTTIPSKFSGI